jgi:hypothetical protein
MAKLNGVILFEGASVLDGSPIAMVATLKTTNVKTGAMVQTWIIRTDINPVEASKQKLDSSICGMCPHRHSLSGACYVNIGQAPNAVYKAYKAGKYAKLDATNVNLLKGRQIRLGAYGDPAAIPFNVLALTAHLASGVTGYTHQFHHKNFDSRVAEFCMISSDTQNEAMRIQKQGFKTFRVKTESDKKITGEVECLADSKGLTCSQCMKCNGLHTSNNIVINVHGSRKNRYADKFGKIEVK